MEIDYSKIEIYDSGKSMKGLVDFINEKLEALFPDFPIEIFPEGVPYMFSMIQWEVLLTDTKSIWFEGDNGRFIKLKLLLYPAGFRVRPHDVIPYKEEIVLSIKETIDIIIERCEEIANESITR